MNINDIIVEIKTQMQPLMEMWKESQFKSVAKYKEIRSSDEYKTLRDEWARSAFMNSRGYTKFMACNYANGYVWWDEYLNKSIAQKLTKIDVAVNKKLKGLDIVKVEELMAYASSKDGYVEGIWALTLVDGSVKKFRIETIYAGGFNIQCFHVRTLYRLK